MVTSSKVLPTVCVAPLLHSLVELHLDESFAFQSENPEPTNRPVSPPHLVQLLRNPEGARHVLLGQAAHRVEFETEGSGLVLRITARTFGIRSAIAIAGTPLTVLVTPRSSQGESPPRHCLLRVSEVERAGLIVRREDQEVESRRGLHAPRGHQFVVAVQHERV